MRVRGASITAADLLLSLGLGDRCLSSLRFLACGQLSSHQPPPVLSRSRGMYILTVCQVLGALGLQGCVTDGVCLGESQRESER